MSFKGRPSVHQPEPVHCPQRGCSGRWPAQHPGQSPERLQAGAIPPSLVPCGHGGILMGHSRKCMVEICLHLDFLKTLFKKKKKDLLDPEGECNTLAKFQSQVFLGVFLPNIQTSSNFALLLLLPLRNSEPLCCPLLPLPSRASTCLLHGAYDP